MIDGAPAYLSVWNHPLLDYLSVDPADAITVYKSPQPLNFGNGLAAVDMNCRLPWVLFPGLLCCWLALAVLPVRAQETPIRVAAGTTLVADIVNDLGQGHMAPLSWRSCFPAALLPSIPPGEAVGRGGMVEVAGDQVRSIATAAQQQSVTSEEINRAIESISHIASETADAMSQSSQAVTELANQAQTLRSLVADIQDGGHQLAA